LWFLFPYRARAQACVSGSFSPASTTLRLRVFEDYRLIAAVSESGCGVKKGGATMSLARHR